MESNLASSQPAINICSQIKCPFYNSDSSGNRCTRYFNSCYCHLTLVFAFQADGYSLFTTKESELIHIKQVNENWIAQNTNKSIEIIERDIVYKNIKPTKFPLINRKNTPKTIPPYLPDFLGYIVNKPSMIGESFLASSVTLLNSIQFEEY